MKTENEIIEERKSVSRKMWVSSNPETEAQIRAKIAELEAATASKGKLARERQIDTLRRDIPPFLIVKAEALQYAKLNVMRRVAEAQDNLNDQRKRLIGLLADGEQMLTDRSYYVNDLVSAEAAWRCWHDIHEAAESQTTLAELRAELKTLTDKINANAWRYADNANRLDVDSAVNRRWAEILHGIAENRLPWILAEIDTYIKAPSTMEELAQQAE